MIVEQTEYTSPWAPWNDRDNTPNEIECPYCGGRGYFFGAENIATGEQVNCKETTYHLLPATVEEAHRQRYRWVQWQDECPECCGTGMVEEEVLSDEALLELSLGI